MNRKYEVFFAKKAKNNLKKTNKNDARIIMAWISKNLVNCKDPYKSGEPLRGDVKGQWRYRVGDYRMMTNIDDEKIIILILEIGHIRGIYKQK